MCQFCLAAHKRPLSAEETVRDPPELIKLQSRVLMKRHWGKSDTTIPSITIFNELEYWTILDLQGF